MYKIESRSFYNWGLTRFGLPLQPHGRGLCHTAGMTNAYRRQFSPWMWTILKRQMQGADGHFSWAFD